MKELLVEGWGLVSGFRILGSDVPWTLVGREGHRFWRLGSGFRIPDSGFWVLMSALELADRFWWLGSGFRIPDSEFWVLMSLGRSHRFWRLGSGFRIPDSGFWVLRFWGLRTRGI